MRVHHRTLRLVRAHSKSVYSTAIAVLAAVAGCVDNSAQIPFFTEASLTRDEGGVVLTLANTLRDLAVGEYKALPLERRLTIGDTDATALVRVADVAPMGEGRFAVLDGREARIVIYDSAGVLVSTLGRRGQGPGEFVSPWALGYGMGWFVIWDSHPHRTFTIVSADGADPVLRVRPIDGDWTNHTFREPTKRLDDIQHGPEEVTHRLRSDPARADWIQIVQADESSLLAGGTDSIRPPTYVVRFQYSGDAVDTIAVLEGPWTHPERDTPRGFSRAYVQATFSPRPLAAAGDGWVATGTGDSAAVHIVFDGGEAPVSIRWPILDEPLSFDDKQSHANWVLSHALSQPGAAERWKGFSRRQKERELRGFIEFETWTPRVPQLAGMWGGGGCLLLAGFAADDSPFGQANRMLLIKADDPAQRWFVSVPRGRRVRAIHGQDLFAVRRGEMDEWLVEVYRLPDACVRTLPDRRAWSGLSYSPSAVGETP
jgi:hypothetical protein